MKEQIDALKNTAGHLHDAQTIYSEFLRIRKRPDAEGVLALIADAAKTVTQMCENLATERDRRNARLYGRGIIRVPVCGGGHSREVTVQRPDNVCDTPYVSEASYNALRFAFKTSDIRTGCGFDVSVVSPGGRVVYVIRNAI